MWRQLQLFAILQKYDFSSKSQLNSSLAFILFCCLRYCKSTIFQANHNDENSMPMVDELFAILQKYDFSSKSQHTMMDNLTTFCCLRYCKSTIFQANHNKHLLSEVILVVVCDTAKVRFFKQITTLRIKSACVT